MLKIENMWGQLLILYKVCGVKKIRKNWESAGTQRGFKKKKKNNKTKNLPLQVPPYYELYKMYQNHGVW